MHAARFRFLVALFVVSLCACGGEQEGEPDGDVPEARDESAWFYTERDCFPAVTEPGFVEAAEARDLDDHHEVLGVVVGGQARAYPTTMLAYHHLVNDAIGDVPVLVTYCVLCSTGAAYDPRVDGERLRFGVEGNWRGTATLYDTKTKSVWLQVTGACVSGPLKGRTLAPRPGLMHTTWGTWRRLHPDTQVMKRDAANVRAGEAYFTPRGARSGVEFIPPELRSVVRYDDDRLAPSDLVYGIASGGHAWAFPFRALRRKPVVQVAVGGLEVTVWFDIAARTAAAYRRRAGERVLSFRLDAEGAFRDDATGSRWTIDGRCREGALAGTQLEPVHGVTSEWYGWSAAHPGTRILGD
jgi:hypothetical protein